MTKKNQNTQNSNQNLREVLKLFWIAAQPLKKVVSGLPNPDNFKMNITAKIKTEDLPGISADDIAELLESSVGAELKITLPNLPEETFERLVLRFRPFYSDGESIHFLKVLSQCGRQWPEFRDTQAVLKAQWNRAAFWGGMEFSTDSIKVNAEDVIKLAFYSTYFHFDVNKRGQLEKYRLELGEDKVRVALISSVWRRADIVCNLTELLEPPLLAQGIISDKMLTEAKTLYEQPPNFEFTTITNAGGIRVQPLPRTS